MLVPPLLPCTPTGLRVASLQCILGSGVQPAGIGDAAVTGWATRAPPMTTPDARAGSARAERLVPHVLRSLCGRFSGQFGGGGGKSPRASREPGGQRCAQDTGGDSCPRWAGEVRGAVNTAAGELEGARAAFASSPALLCSTAASRGGLRRVVPSRYPSAPGPAPHSGTLWMIDAGKSDPQASAEQRAGPERRCRGRAPPSTAAPALREHPKGPGRAATAAAARLHPPHRSQAALPPGGEHLEKDFDFQTFLTFLVFNRVPFFFLLFFLFF